MNGRKSIAFGAVIFALRTLVDHIRLFMFILLAEAGVSAVVVGSVIRLNKGFIQEVIASDAMQNFQECVGFSDCSSIAYQSRALLMKPGAAKVFIFLFSVFILGFVFCGLYLGLNKVALALCDQGKSSVKQLFACFTLVPRYFGTVVLYFTAIIVGLIFFIVPGLFIAIRFSLFPFFIIDKNAGVFESLKMSYEATRNHVWNWIVLCIAVSIITGIPKMLLSYFGFMSWIGLVFAVPFTALVYSYFYRSLVTQQSNRLSDEF